MSDDPSTSDNVVSEVVTELVHETVKRATKENITVHVGSMYWNDLWTFFVTEETKISRIKMLCLVELFGSEFDQHITYYMLTFPAGNKSLKDIKTVKEEQLKDNDELELIQLPPVEDDQFIQFSHHISESSIVQATRHLPDPREIPQICNVVLDIQPPEFMSDVRKIMITLIEYSLTVMSTKPNAKYIFDVVRRKLMSENFYVDESMISKYQSTTSHSSTRRIKFAISASYNDSFTVQEWLSETQSIDSIDLGIPISFHVDETIGIEEELADLLKLFHHYLRASFKICTKATEILVEMGFELENVTRALRYTGNNTSEAMIYLLGYTDPNNDGAKSGLDTGMSSTSDMYKLIMSEGEIILPLSNPTVLYACLSVMDANSFLISSVRFPIIMNLLNKILTTYYVAKCDMAMRQMLGHIPND